MKTGKEIYQQFISERQKRIRTATAVWVCMLVISIFCTIQGSIFGGILAIFGILLAVFNLLSYRKVARLLDLVGDKDQFFKELESAVTDSDENIKICENYVLLRNSEIQVLYFQDMQKVEVGIQGQVKRTLFLTDKNAKRHVILSCFQGDGRQEEFDQVYHLLREKVS